jgi:putative transposase
MIELACQYGRYGYRRITILLITEGWQVNHKRVERLWHEEGLKVVKKQPKRKRLWFNDGSCVRLRPAHKDDVWSYDFVADRTSDGRAVRMLNVIDEYTRECLAIRVDRKITANDVIDTLADIFIERGTPRFIRSDNGPEFVAQLLRDALQHLGVQTAFIEPGSPWENGYIESFNGKLRDELLNGEVFDTIFEARVITEQWRYHYNTIRPHSALGYRPPAPETFIPLQLANG